MKFGFLEHNPVFTQGQNGKAEHILNAGDIPIIQIDRGGQVTYHGPGQLVAYLLIDLKRHQLGVRDFVSAIENAVIDTLKDYGIHAGARKEAPGVYIDNAKIASLGLRIRRGCSYHGLAFNINMDLEPFNRINPCGLTNITMTQVADEKGPASVEVVKQDLLNYFIQKLGYNEGLKINGAI